MENFIITLAYLFLGMALRLTRRLPGDFSNSLNLFVIYVSLPALVLLKVPGMRLGKELLLVAILPWVMMAFGAVAVLLMSRINKWNSQVTGCLLLMACLGNTSFLGIPMVRAFFGEHGVSFAIIYDQLGSFLGLATYGSLVLAIYGKESKAAPGLHEISMKIITFPPFIALILAFFLKFMPPLPQVAHQVLSSLGATLVPVVMIAVGYQLRLRLEPGTLGPLASGLFLKLVAAPAFALLTVRLLGMGGEPARVAVFEAGMPPMVSAGALAILANLSPRLTAALVGAGIFLSFLTLPVLYRLINLMLLSF